jgi:hypothetical protein
MLGVSKTVPSSAGFSKIVGQPHQVLGKIRSEEESFLYGEIPLAPRSHAEGFE